MIQENEFRQIGNLLGTNQSLLMKAISHKAQLQREILNDLTLEEKLCIASSIENQNTISKLVVLAKRRYSQERNDYNLYCLAIALTTIFKEYEWPNYLDPYKELYNIALRISQ